LHYNGVNICDKCRNIVTFRNVLELARFVL